MIKLAPRRWDAPAITPRQRETWRLAALGMTDKEIAAALFVSTATAKNHVQAVRDALGITGRVALALTALHHGIITAEDIRAILPPSALEPPA